MGPPGGREVSLQAASWTSGLGGCEWGGSGDPAASAGGSWLLPCAERTAKPCVWDIGDRAALCTELQTEGSLPWIICGASGGLRAFRAGVGGPAERSVPAPVVLPAAFLHLFLRAHSNRGHTWARGVRATQMVGRTRWASGQPGLSSRAAPSDSNRTGNTYQILKVLVET